MADVKIKSDLTFKAVIHLELSGEEAAALDEITKYGIEPFLEGYKKQLGSAYIEPHEKGLRSLFKTIEANLPDQIYKLKKYREALMEVMKKYK